MDAEAVGRKLLPTLWRPPKAPRNHTVWTVATSQEMLSLCALSMRIKFWPPPPTPEFLSKDFCLQPGLERKFLLRRTWSGQKTAPTAISRISTLLARETRFPYEGFTSHTTRFRCKFNRLGGWGWKNDPGSSRLTSCTAKPGHLGSGRLCVTSSSLLVEIHWKSIAFWGVIAFVQHAPRKASASKMLGVV